MNRFSAALFVFAFALGFCRGTVADDANPPVIVNNISSTLPPVTIWPEISTESTSTTNTTSSTPTTSSSTSSTTTTTTSSTSKPTTTSVPPVPPNSTTTVPPQTTTASLPTTAAPHKVDHFDGPSFIGGIILATGLMGIGFVAFKFYKARTERNYHTL